MLSLISLTNFCNFSGGFKSGIELVAAGADNCLRGIGRGTGFIASGSALLN